MFLYCYLVFMWLVPYIHVQCSTETVVAVEFHPLDPGLLITCGKGKVVIVVIGIFELSPG